MKKTPYYFNSLVCGALLLICFAEANATGALFSRPRWSDQQYNKMWIKSLEVDIKIEEQVAVTHVDQVFFNELNTSVEAILIFPLPENAVLSAMVYWVNGQRYEAHVRERQEAINAYNNKLRQWLDPALLEYLGDNLFRLSIVPIDARSEVRIEITYVEPLSYDFGVVNYTYQLNTVELSSQPLETVSVALDATSKNKFTGFRSPSHENSTATQIQKISDSHYTLLFGDENFYPDTDLVVHFELDRRTFDVNILTYTPAPEDSFGADSFYALWLVPPDTVGADQVIPKDVIFTVDLSSSMEGERLQQVKLALEEFLNLLNEADRFNIITFGTFVEKFKPDLVEVENSVISEAREFIFRMFALGLTNINDALVASLQQSYNPQASNNLIFLTDGEPTWGETDPDSILSAVARNNTAEVSIFAFGVGEDINRSLLTGISRDNYGFARFIARDDSIAMVVNDHFQRISKPVLRDIEIDLGGLQSRDEYPKEFADLFWGSQIFYMGLYNNSGAFEVALRGRLSAADFEYRKSISFPDTIGGHRFVPRLWAKAKIDNILELIERFGESDELIEQIIELSLRFQILTPYTAFYVDPDEEDDDGDVTSVNDAASGSLPTEFALAQNYPNPFNPTTLIKYALPAGANSYQVVIKIYDVLGRLVAVLLEKEQAPGFYQVQWNGRNINGQPVASGIYIYEIRAGNFRQSRKMALIR